MAMPALDAQQQWRRYASALRDGWRIFVRCECKEPIVRLVGGDWYVTTVCLRCRRRARSSTHEAS